MSFSARYLPAVLLTVLGLTASLYAQSTVKQTKKTPGGSVSGRVTIKEKGVAGVAVGMRKSDVMMPFEPYMKATTDENGFYRITNVVPGSYDISPSAPAFVTADAKDAKSKNVLVGEDENVEGINFTLVRGGVITGRVTDADGRPVIQQAVTLYRSDAFDQQSPQRPAFASANAQTDDRGIYRMFGLTAGRYKVASGRSEGTFNASFGPARTTYKQVFHPDVSDQGKATVIEVSEGSEAGNVDITLGRALQTFAASGRVVESEKGLPVPNLRFGLQRSVGQRTEFVSAMVISNNQGDFVIEGLIPGKYGIYLFPNQNNEMRAEAFSFDIIDQDVSGVTLKLSKGATLSGIVVLENEDKAGFEKLSQLQLRAFVMVQSGGGGFGSSAVSPISPDGSFRLAGLASGTVNFSLSSATNPMPLKGFTIARIERDGIVSTHRFEIKDGEQLTGVRVVLSYGNASLRGVVKVENGSLPEGTRILVRLNKPGDNRPLMATQVDSRGHFLMQGIPPGTYELIAAVGASTNMPARTVKQEVLVQEGAATEAIITIDLATPPKP